MGIEIAVAVGTSVIAANAQNSARGNDQGSAYEDPILKRRREAEKSREAVIAETTATIVAQNNVGLYLMTALGLSIVAGAAYIGWMLL